MGFYKKISNEIMPEPEVLINDNKINGSTQIVLNLKSITVIVGLICSTGGTIFGIINSKLGKLNDQIIELKDQDIKVLGNELTIIKAQNKVIGTYYGVDLEMDAIESAEDRRGVGGRPTSMPGE